MKRILSLFAALLLCGSALAQSYVPSPENLRERAAFQQHRLGIFLHWGIYATYAQGEWYLETAGLRQEDYAVAAQSFCPARFDAAAWARAFRDAGAGYVTITSRHHDGFSMFKTATSAYNVVDGTPFGRDIVGELEKACKEAGIRLHLYYSLLDWIREDYPIGESGKKTGRKGGQENYDSYFRFMETQVKELLTQYPYTGGLWFDGIWDHKRDQIPFDWRMPEFYRFIHAIKPDCLIGNNHHITPFEGEDFQMFERDLPGQNTAGYSEGQQVSTVMPVEMCQTMNKSWGYTVKDLNYKSTTELVRLLVKAASKGCNLLLNIGPQADGRIPWQSAERLKGIGEWMRTHARSVDGTDKTGLPDQGWGVTTANAESLFLHVIAPEALPSNGKEALLSMAWDGPKVKTVKVVSTGAVLPCTVSKDGFLTVRIPQEMVEEIDTVLEVAR
jgi:alpha-L-fucosidase